MKYKRYVFALLLCVTLFPLEESLGKKKGSHFRPEKRFSLRAHLPSLSLPSLSLIKKTKKLSWLALVVASSLNSPAEAMPLENTLKSLNALQEKGLMRRGLAEDISSLQLTSKEILENRRFVEEGVQKMKEYIETYGDGRIGIFKVIERGDRETFDFLFQHMELDPSLKYHGFEISLLHYAAFYGRSDIFFSLLRKGAFLEENGNEQKVSPSHMLGLKTYDLDMGLKMYEKKEISLEDQNLIEGRRKIHSWIEKNRPDLLNIPDALGTTPQERIEFLSL